MKKAGILTYYNVHNHGSSLQSNATRIILESMGYDVYFLSFQRNYDFISQESKNKYSISLKSIPFYFKYAFKKGIRNILFNYKKHKKLNKFEKKSGYKSIRYSDFDGDLCVIGSDEVFSLEIGVNPFFYGVGLKTKKIISYAGSFGPTTIEFINDRRLRGIVCGGFNNIESIGVRDKNSQNIIKEIAGRESSIVCDPVILYGYENEQTLYRPKTKNKYVLVYSYDKNLNDSKSISIIRSFCKKHGFKIYSVGYYHKWCDKNICPDPIQLLGFFKNAAFVITNTFHGVVLSLVTHSQFLAQVCGNANKLKFLVQEYCLDDRIAESLSNLDDLFADRIDYSRVSLKMEEIRKRSFDFLVKSIRDK